ncbi:PREDICTED: putative late blight resistance protein homolog R1A-10 [Ipomoea nil]|uniref:putative late blight resistance protein homolog R1A-10 n=1 Tax=Ipomoea nil TaxID=35883 RepID=UPI0009017321|nr:PREDICTED: putative late blight resistance protein homolog R1A-10 [Ipomoea nil]
MAWFAVTSLMRTIELEFLQPYPRLVLDYTEAEAVEALHRRLAQLLAFLDNHSENQLNDDDDTTKEWKGRIKEVALRIEEEIESQIIIDVCGREDPRRRFLGRVDDYIQPQRFLPTLQNGTREFMELVKNKQPMKDLQIKDDEIPSSSSEKIEHYHHSAGSKLLRSTTMVGHDDEVNLIKELLLQDSPKKERRVVPIVGMGGIGKTKLVQTLYEDLTVTSHFDVVAWTTVSAQSDMRQMLLQLLSIITQEVNVIYKSNEELADLLRRRLMGRRYLIVVDDLWSTGFWDEIQRCFPENSNGSRILVTTRLQQVAISTGGSHNYWLNLPFLNPDESWELFNQRILNYGSLSLPMKLEGIWRYIVEYCKGLPLAIVIVAGLVQATNESLWESESEEIEKILCATVTNGLLDSFSEILRLSYNHLPNVLKVCFLYLGVFREDSAIPMKKLIRLWIAEGFVKVEDERSLEEVGEDYLKDLVSRSLVLIDSLSLDGKIKSCKVHDIVHDFCRNEATKEGLLHVASRYSSVTVRTTERWLSLESMYPKLDVHTGFNRYGSLFCFHDDDDHTTPQVYQLPETPYFKRLRVLDLGSLHFINGIPSCVADLILLRYLALCPSKSLNSLPVLKDWNLQTLVLLGNRGGSTSTDPNPLIPAQIWELRKLRHLQVCTTFVFGTPTEVHQYIQTVQWLRPFQCTEQVFLRIPNAKVMGILIDIRVEFGEPNCLDNLRCLHQLEELKIKTRHFYPVLLPDVDAFPVQLKKLKLRGTSLPWDSMKVIGMLPNLQVLKLKNRACRGKYWDWKPTGDSFPRLKSLLIYTSYLTYWYATGNGFPVLERLIIKQCYGLEAIPSSFEDIDTLQLIELSHCYLPLVNSAKQIQEVQRDYGNEQLVVRAYNIWRR